MHLDQLKRREFITLLGGGSLLAPFAASDQEGGEPIALQS